MMTVEINKAINKYTILEVSIIANAVDIKNGTEEIAVFSKKHEIDTIA